MKKYNQVMQRYFVQYLSGYDAVVLNQLIQVSVYDYCNLFRFGKQIDCSKFSQRYVEFCPEVNFLVDIIES